MNLSDEPVSDSEEIFEEAVEDLEEEYCQTLNSDTLQFAAEEIGETDSVREGCVRDMRRWVESQPHFHNCRTDANFLCRFLRTNKFKLEKSCQMLERYLKMRLAHPKWFQNLDIQVRTALCKVHYFNVLSSGPDGAGADRVWLHLRVAGEGQSGEEGGVQRGQGAGPQQTQHIACSQSSHRYI